MPLGQKSTSSLEGLGVSGSRYICNMTRTYYKTPEGWYTPKRKQWLESIAARDEQIVRFATQHPEMNVKKIGLQFNLSDARIASIIKKAGVKRYVGIIDKVVYQAAALRDVGKTMIKSADETATKLRPGVQKCLPEARG
jgi:hypothetical protein